MQATIERDTPQQVIRLKVVTEAPPGRTATPYRAPLATFLALVASGRASACAAQADDNELVGAHV